MCPPPWRLWLASNHLVEKAVHLHSFLYRILSHLSQPPSTVKHQLNLMVWQLLSRLHDVFLLVKNVKPFHVDVSHLESRATSNTCLNNSSFCLILHFRSSYRLYRMTLSPGLATFSASKAKQWGCIRVASWILETHGSKSWGGWREATVEFQGKKDTKLRWHFSNVSNRHLTIISFTKTTWT